MSIMELSFSNVVAYTLPKMTTVWSGCAYFNRFVYLRTIHTVVLEWAAGTEPTTLFLLSYPILLCINLIGSDVYAIPSCVNVIPIRFIIQFIRVFFRLSYRFYLFAEENIFVLKLQSDQCVVYDNLSDIQCTFLSSIWSYKYPNPN